MLRRTLAVRHRKEALTQHDPGDLPKVRLRRHFLAAAFGGLAIAGGGFAAWLRGPPGTLSAPASLAAARSWIAALGASVTARSTRGWPLPQVLQHAAQSVEYSLDGYPQPKPEWFQRSAGTLAYATFDRLGAMRHGLTEAIPGAPPLDAVDLGAAAQLLLSALDRFEAHGGTLAPHFAYGALDKPAYTRAHLMHLADHARWIEVTAA